MANTAAPLVSRIASNFLHPCGRAFSLRGKITLVLSGVLAVMTGFNVVLLYHFTHSILEGQLERRATTLATDLRNAAELFANNSLELHTLTTKYARLEGVAYVFVKDAKNDIAAHSMGIFPPELDDTDWNQADKRIPRQRTFEWRGHSVFETRTPVLEGQAGSVYVGLWKDPIRSDAQIILFPLIGLMAVVLAIGIFAVFFLAPIILRPIRELRTVASRISRGDLDVTVRTDSEDEIGDLGSSLERMRASLKAAMNRLDAL